MPVENITFQTGLHVNQNEATNNPGSLRDCNNVILRKLGQLEKRYGFSTQFIPYSETDITFNGVTYNHRRYEILHVLYYEQHIIIFTNHLVFKYKIVENVSYPLLFNNSNVVPVGIFDGNINSIYIYNGVYYTVGRDVFKLAVNFDGDVTDAVKINLEEPDTPYASTEDGLVINPDGIIGRNQFYSYRVVYTRYTDDGRKIETLPSEPFHIIGRNNDSRYNVRLRLILPSYADTSGATINNRGLIEVKDKVEIYRTRIRDISNNTVIHDASTFYYLVDEIDAHTFNLHNIPGNNRVFIHDYDDNKKDDVLGRTLYTNGNIENGNYLVPHANINRIGIGQTSVHADVNERDVAELSFHNLDNSFLLQGSNSHITFTVNTNTIIQFEGSNITNLSELDNLGQNQYAIRSTLNTAEYIRTTLDSLAFKINTHHELKYIIKAKSIHDTLDNRDYLYLEKISNDNLLIAGTNITNINFLSGITNRNRIYFSKAGIPAYSSLNDYIDVGDENRRILNIRNYQGSLIVFKEDGIFELRYITQGNYTINKINDDILIGEVDNVDSYENHLYFLSRSGLKRFDGRQVEDIGFNINPLIRQIQNENSVKILFYDKEKTLFIKYDTEVLLYHFETNNFTKWDFNFDSFFIENDNLFFYNRQSILQYEIGRFSDINLNYPVRYEENEVIFNDTMLQVFVVNANPSNQEINITFRQNNTSTSLRVNGSTIISLNNLEAINDEIMSEAINFFTDYDDIYSIKELAFKTDGNLSSSINVREFFDAGNTQFYFNLFRFGTNTLQVLMRLEQLDNGLVRLHWLEGLHVTPTTDNTLIAATPLTRYDITTDLVEYLQTINNFGSTNFYDNNNVLTRHIGNIHKVLLPYTIVSSDEFYITVNGVKFTLTREPSVIPFNNIGFNYNVYTISNIESFRENLASSLFSALQSDNNSVSIGLLSQSEFKVDFHRINVGEPARLKEFQKLHFLFNNTSLENTSYELETDISSTKREFPITSIRNLIGNSWGQEGFNWGGDGTIWGGDTYKNAYEKISIDRNYRRAINLFLTVKDKSLDKNINLQNIQFTYEMIDDRQR